MLIATAAATMKTIITAPTIPASQTNVVLLSIIEPLHDLECLLFGKTFEVHFEFTVLDTNDNCSRISFSQNSVAFQKNQDRYPKTNGQTDPEIRHASTPRTS